MVKPHGEKIHVKDRKVGNIRACVGPKMIHAQESTRLKTYLIICVSAALQAPLNVDCSQTRFRRWGYQFELKNAELGTKPEFV